MPPSAPPERTPDEDDVEDNVGIAPAGERPPHWSIQMGRVERTIFELARRWANGTFDLQPDFQREFVWDLEKQVNLVESVLLRIPIPVIYLSEESEERTLVIDGQQRMTTLFRYMRDEFALTNLRLLPELNGLVFSRLEPRLQRRFEDTPITAFVIQTGSDSRIKFEVFQRLNQGAVELNPQEIRNCLYQGPGLLMVKRLAAPGGLFREVAGRNRTFRRMRADELVLRCLAFLDQGPERYRGDLLDFLNEELVRLNRMDSETLSNLGRRFEDAISSIAALMGTNAFRRYDPQRQMFSSALNAAVMDVLVYSFGRMPALYGALVSRKDVVKSLLVELSREPLFVDAISHSTGDKSRVLNRFRLWMNGITHAASDHC